MNKSIKVLATYLPQFHRVKENDEWWGEGFTEWTAVKHSKPLFKGHNQPRIPLNKNYYNLLSKETMQWQADLAKKFLIDGFCFWHYWFKDGRKILERPAENLLQWKDVNMPFCFCWANETWARTWSNIPNPNYWSTKYEPSKDNMDDGVLLRQNYGTERQWQDHFYYLLPFFKDERYVKHFGMPVFVIFRPFLIDCIVPMIECWNKLSKKNGLEGIYLISWGLPEIEYPYQANITDILQNTGDIYLKKTKGGTLKIIDYDKLWNDFLNMSVSHVQTEYLCGCVGYDTTPRNGMSGIILDGATPQKFRQYFGKLIKKSICNKNEYVFLNAWNEWAEGNYLEPDEFNGYEYLEAVKDVMYKIQNEDCDKCVDGIVSSHKESFVVANRQINKFKKRYYVLCKWLSLKLINQSLEKFFIERNYKKIAIYGWGDLGRLLSAELDGTSVDISYIIDRRGRELDAIDIPAYVPHDNELPNVDVIIVTVVDEFTNIYDSIRGIVSCEIISLSSVVDEV